MRNPVAERTMTVLIAPSRMRDCPLIVSAYQHLPPKLRLRSQTLPRLPTNAIGGG